MIMHGCFTPRVVSGFVVETIIKQHLGAGTGNYSISSDLLTYD
jgi:hypothetical protein